MVMKAVVATVLTTLLIQFGSLGSGMLAAHLLLPEGRGELAAAILWPSAIAYLTIFGLQDAMLYFSAQTPEGENQREALRRVFASGLWIGLVLSGVAVAIGIWIVAPLAYADYRPEIRELATVMMAIIPLHIFGLVFQEMLRGRLRLTVWNLLRVLLQLGYVGLILLFLVFQPASVTNFGLAFLGSHLPPMLIAAGVCVAAGWGGARFSWPTIRRMAIYGARLHASAVVLQLNQRLDQMLIARFLAPASLGLYVVANTLAQVTATLANSVTMVAFPRACAAAPGAERAAVIGVYLRATMVLVMLGTGALFILAPYVLRLLFGPGFVEATDIVRILLLGVAAISLKEFFILAFKADDKALALAQAEVVTLIVNAGLLAMLVPMGGAFGGLTGAAIAFVAVRWISAGYLGWLARRDLALSMRQLFTPTQADLLLLRDVAAKLKLRR
jgi:O-antigen/teichoic acid export membrane protein